MKVHVPVRSLGGICLILLGAANVFAQDARDPTAAPLLPAAAASTAGTPLRDASNAVVVRNGVSYLVVGTRLVGVGQRVGTATLERITETEIWLRGAEGLQKSPRFAGIQRQVAGSAGCTHSKSALKKRGATPPAHTACGGIQP